MYSYRKIQDGSWAVERINANGCVDFDSYHNTPESASERCAELNGKDCNDPVAEADDLRALRAFVGELLADYPDSYGLDGWEVLELCDKHGLLKREDRVAPCGENCYCSENYGDGETDCRVVQPVMSRAIGWHNANTQPKEQP